MLDLATLLVDTRDRHQSPYKRVIWGAKARIRDRHSKYGGVFRWETKDPKIEHEI